MKSIKKIKARYYLKEFLKYLLVAGAISLSGAGAGLGWQFSKRTMTGKKSIPDKSKSLSTFYYLKRRNLIKLQQEGHDVLVSLTAEGKKLAGKYQINDLTVEKPNKWDGKWRMVIFDIPNTSGLIRNVFRGKLREFGFYPLQKSVWIFPFDCREEIIFLRDFLGADKTQILFMEISRIENEIFLRDKFSL
ncbi:MAG: hypothetical protein Q8N56_01185 [bacterium]|nr:hypothetical protein [bacterium]